MDFQEVYVLRHELHQHPELSLQEKRTRQYLISWLEERTSLHIVELERGFLAIKEPDGPATCCAIAFRADYDALPIEESDELPYRSVNPGVSHKCGHDGHSAVLCGFALALEEMPINRRVILVFQGGEEIGQGGESCALALRQYGVSEVYAFHNRSGYLENAIVIRKGITQCASEGLTIFFMGKASHASSPEDGVNPATAVAKLILYMRNISDLKFNGLVMVTIVHVKVGSLDFGISPSNGLVSVTLRAEIEREMREAEQSILQKTEELAMMYGLKFSYERQDIFPETVNHDQCAQKVADAARRLGFHLIETDEVWRASEDFGYYTKHYPGAIFYIGNGEDYPALHTVEYDFNDRIMETAVEIFRMLI